MKENNEPPIAKVITLNGKYYALSGKLPRKGQDILIESEQGQFTLGKAQTDMVQLECMQGKRRTVWSILGKTD